MIHCHTRFGYKRLSWTKPRHWIQNRPLLPVTSLQGQKWSSQCKTIKTNEQQSRVLIETVQHLRVCTLKNLILHWLEQFTIVNHSTFHLLSMKSDIYVSCLEKVCYELKQDYNSPVLVLHILISLILCMGIFYCSGASVITRNSFWRQHVFNSLLFN